MVIVTDLDDNLGDSARDSNHENEEEQEETHDFRNRIDSTVAVRFRSRNATPHAICSLRTGGRTRIRIRTVFLILRLLPLTASSRDCYVSHQDGRNHCR